MTNDPGEPPPAAARHQTDSSFSNAGADAPSRWRVLFAIVPLAVIVIVGLQLLSVWTDAGRHVMREVTDRELARAPPTAAVPTPVVVDVPRDDPIVDPGAVVALLGQADAEDGAHTFRMCGACHAAERGGAHKVGPNLWGVLGRKKADNEGFAYSAALKAKGGTWTAEELAAYLNAPRAFAPGTSMNFRGITDARRIANLIAYLRSRSDLRPDDSIR
jgi:cytochrome c2